MRCSSSPKIQVTGCYWIENGLLKVSIVSGSGAESIIAILGAGAIVGELAVLDGLPRSATVLALRDSELLFVSKAKFDQCAHKHPELYQHLLTLLASRLRETNDVIAAESFLPLRGRVALTLMDLGEHFGERAEGRIVIRHKFGQSVSVATRDRRSRWSRAEPGRDRFSRNVVPMSAGC